MLTEFAFTPSIFDEDVHEDKEAWLEQLKELARRMFPGRGEVSSAVVADLYDGSCLSEVKKIIDSMEEDSRKTYCLSLLEKLRGASLERPAICEWPGDCDLTWCAEALESHRVEAIERIVSVQHSKQLLGVKGARVRTLNEVSDGGFWAGIKSVAEPHYEMDEQLGLLRKIWICSDWVALINPYTSYSETLFCTNLLKRAFGENPFNRLSDFEVHFSIRDPDKKDDYGRTTSENVTTNLARNISSERIPEPYNISLYGWNKKLFLDRYFVGGQYSSGPEGKTKASKWAIYLGHVVREDDGGDVTTQFNFVSKKKLSWIDSNFIQEKAKDKPDLAVKSTLP